MTELTKYLNLNKPDFNSQAWHEPMNDTIDMVDAIINQIIGITSEGFWENSTEFVIGDRVIDPIQFTMWECLVGHTSPSSGSFLDYRAGNPTHWGQIIVGSAGQLPPINEGDAGKHIKVNAGENGYDLTPGAAVDSVNAKTGTVVLDPDDLDDATAAHKFVSAAQRTKLDGIETGATADQTNAEIETAYNAQVNAASQAEMEAGTEAAIRRMSPLRVAEAIAALAPGGSGAVDSVFGRTGDVLAAASDYAITQIDFANSGRIAARITAGAGVSEEATPAQIRTLLNVEDGAAADQTGAEIKTAYEGETDTNAFTDALLSKLNGIEASATADQTGAEIKTAYEGETDTNAFTDALLSKLNAIEAGAEVNDVDSVFGRTGAVAALAGDYDSVQIDYDGTTSGLAATDVKAALDEIVADLATHEALTNNPHGVTKTQVGLGNVSDNAQLKIASNLSDVNNAATSFANIKQQATDAATGVAELATAAEVTTGSDTSRIVTPSAYKQSSFGRRVITYMVEASGNDLVTGDGLNGNFIPIPAELDGWNLVDPHAHVFAAGTGAAVSIQVHNVTDAVDMLTTPITIDDGEKSSVTAATPPSVDTSNDDVTEGDQLRIDVDSVPGTAPKGLVVTLAFEKP